MIILSAVEAYRHNSDESKPVSADVKETNRE